MKTFEQYKRIDDTLAVYENKYNNKNNINGEASFKFKPELYYQLRANRQYEYAYEYGSKFIRHNPEENKAFRMQLANDLKEGRKESYFYSQLQQNPDMMHQAEFYRNVFVNNGLSNLVNKEDNNPYAEKFINAKKRIGSSVKKNGDIDIEAVKLSVTFKPKGSSWFLKDWITGTDEDVDYLELFYSQSGLNKQQLKASNVDIEEKDGNTTITFDKSNPIANKILYGLDFQDAYEVGYYGQAVSYNTANNAPTIKGYDVNDKEIKQNNELKEINEFYDVSGSLIDTNNLSNASEFRRMIDEAKYFNTKAEEFVSKEDGGYQGFVIPINKEEVKSKNIDEGIGLLEASNLEIYSNAYNENDDTTLRFVEQLSDDDDDNRKVELMNYIKTNIDRAHYGYANYGDKIGMLITIDPYSITDNTAKELDKNMDLEQGYRGKEVRVFISNLYTNEANEAINNNSQIRAIRESNDMQKYGYGYKLYDNREIMYDGNGSFVYQDTYKTISQDEAIRLIHKSQLMDDSKFLKYEYINSDNRIYDYTNFDNHAKQYAISAAMSLNPDIFQVANIDNNIVFVDKQGNKVSINDIFNKKGGGSAVLSKYSQSMNYSTLKFYKDCFDVYMAMIDDAKNYK